MAGRESWNMAQIANDRPLPKERKLHPHTIGAQPGIALKARLEGRSMRACKSCGHHVCSCTSASLSKGFEQAIERGEVPSVNKLSRSAVQAAFRAQVASERARIQDFYAMIDRSEAATMAAARAQAALEKQQRGRCADCARARREMVTHCMCGRPTGC